MVVLMLNQDLQRSLRLDLILFVHLKQKLLFSKLQKFYKKILIVEISLLSEKYILKAEMVR